MNTKTIILLTVFVIIVAGLFLAKPLSSGTLKSDGISEKKGKNKKNKDDVATSETSANITIRNKWDMPSELTEISGVVWMKDNRFACVQDELGTIFIYNAANSSIERKINFGGAGDYEGIAMINDVAYVMRADGVFFKVDNINSSKPTITQHKTHLTVENDIEGFTYDKANNRLLAAMKGDESGNPGYKGVYAIDPSTNKMSTTPVFKLKIDASANTDGKGKKNKGIQPADIGVHPNTNDVYIVDASGPGLVVLTKGGDEKGRYTLSKKDFPQPEGITFSEDGKLFISNEGKKGQGNILEVVVGE